VTAPEMMRLMADEYEAMLDTDRAKRWAMAQQNWRAAAAALREDADRIDRGEDPQNMNIIKKAEATTVLVEAVEMGER